MVSLRPSLADCQRLTRRTASILLGVILAHGVRAADAASIAEAWLAHQTNVSTWTARVTQTRQLKSLVHPLTATGQVWFAAPNLFRWELGDPPQTIAVRQPGQMLVIYPRLKRVERYPLDSDQAGPWRDALALLEAGFPRSRSELERRFRLLDPTSTKDLQTLTLRPRSASARRLMPLIRVGLDPATFQLRFTEIEFADGSTMRNEFSQSLLNPSLPQDTFEPIIDPDWEIVQPGSR